MKISKEKLIEVLRDTESNDFEGVISNLFEKHSVQEHISGFEGGEPDLIMFEEQFRDAMNEYLEMVITFIDNAKS